jgi:hypothetical protein
VNHPGLWPSRWPAEDGGPARLGVPRGPDLAGRDGLGLGPGDELVATSRLAIASTMVVLRDPGEAYLLGHTGGDGAISWVERFDPETLEPLERSPDLPGGPPWPGGVAVHANGSLHVVFGRHAHRLGPDCSVLASRELPRNRPYNSFVTLADGHLVTKDFGGDLPPDVTDAEPIGPAELLVLDPDDLTVVASLELPEPSVARLSAVGDTVYAVGDTALHRIDWDGRALRLDQAFSAAARYRTLDGQTYGWDAVITDDAAWFPDDGRGTAAYAGSLRGCGTSGVPLHLVRVGLADGSVSLTEVSGLPGGIVANPPVVDVGRRIVVAYDSGNGVVAGLAYDEDGRTERRWEVALDHGGHPILFPATGEVLLGDHRPGLGEHLVVLDVTTGAELGRVASDSPIQSVLFGAAGFDRDVYLCSFTTLTRVRAQVIAAG